MDDKCIILNTFSLHFLIAPQPTTFIFLLLYIQLLPYRDRSGRKVIAAISSLGMLFDPETWFKVVLYILLIAVDDLESQQKGIVLVLWPNSDIAETIKSRHPIINSSQLYGSIFKAVPVRVSAFHFCTPGNIPFFNVLRSVFVLVVDKIDRSRVKFHSGESVELQYQMSSYGKLLHAAVIVIVVYFLFLCIPFRKDFFP